MKVAATISKEYISKVKNFYQKLLAKNKLCMLEWDTENHSIASKRMKKN